MTLLETLAGKAAWSLGLKPVGWAADAMVKHAKAWRALERRQKAAVTQWHEANKRLCGDFDPLDFLLEEYASASSAEEELSRVLGVPRVPSPAHWHAVLVERWREISAKRLFRTSTLMKLNEAAAAGHLRSLAEVLSNVLTADDLAYRSEVLAGQRESHALLKKVYEQVQGGPNHEDGTKAKRYINMAGDLPTGLVVRPEELDRVVEHLITDGKTNSTALSTALRGAGGMGKTMLARLVCADERIRKAFPDGVLWVTLGESANPAAELAAIHCALAERATFAGLSEAIQAVGQLVAEREFLLVIDDVWSRSDTHAFFGWGKQSARLLTTRNVKTLPAGTHEVLVDSMRGSESVEILGRGLVDVDLVQRELEELARSLGHWPLLLGLVNAALLERVADDLSLDDALAEVRSEIEVDGMDALDLEDEQSREYSVAKTMAVAQKPLKPKDRDRFGMLGIFPKDVAIPVDVLAVLWNSTTSKTVRLCRRLEALSLAQSFGASGIRLHDVVWRYLRTRLGKPGRISVVECLLAEVLGRFAPQAAVWAELGRSEYLLKNLVSIFVTNGLVGRAYELVTDVSYLEAKAQRFGRYAVEQDVGLVCSLESGDRQRVLTTIERAVRQGSDRRGALESQIHTAMVSAGESATSLRSCSPLLAANHPPQTHDGAERILWGHMGGVEACAVLGDGQHVVSASHDQTLRVWNTQTGETIHVLGGHTGRVVACVVLGDGVRVVSASEDATLRVWNTESGEVIHVLEGHLDLVQACAVLEDGVRVVSGSYDDTLRVWNTESGEIIHVLEGHSDPVLACVALGNGRVVSGSHDSTLRVWDAQTGETVHVLTGHAGPVVACASLAGGSRVVSVSEDETLRVWDTRTGEQIRVFSGHSGYVGACAVLGDQQRVISVSFDRTLRVWDTRTGEAVHILKHSEGVRACAVLGDGSTVIAAAYDKRLWVWDTRTGQQARVFSGHSYPAVACVVLGDGVRVVSASQDNTLRVWDTQAANRQHMFTHPAESASRESGPYSHTGTVVMCKVVAGGRVVSVAEDQTLRVWDTRTGQLEHILTGHTDSVVACAVLGDGVRVVSASRDRTLRVWDTQTGETVHILSGHSGAVLTCAVLGDGVRVVSASRDRTMRVWDTHTGKTVHIFDGHTFSVSACTVLGDGVRLVSASSGTLRVWDSRTGETVRDLVLPGRVVACEVLGDGTRVVAASNDHTLRVWDTQTGNTVHVLSGHSGSVSECVVLGHIVVTASEDHTLRVWDTQTGELLHILADHSAPVVACAALGDGTRVISASADDTLRVWDVDAGRCLGVAHDIPAVSLAARDNLVVAGCRDGNVWFFEVRETAADSEPHGTWFRREYAHSEPGSPIERVRRFLLDVFGVAELRQLAVEVDKELADRLPDNRLTSPTDLVNQLLRKLAGDRDHLEPFVALVRRERPNRDDLDSFELHLRAATRYRA